jgi:hypothetical protein
MVRIPGSRGNIVAPGGQNVANNLNSIQNDLLAKQDGYVVSTIAHQSHLIPICPFSVFQLFHIGMLSKYTTVKFSRIFVTTNDVGEYLECALYSTTARSPVTFYQISGTRAKFDLSNTGLIEVELKQDVILVPQREYFFGFIDTSVKTAWVSGVDYTTAQTSIYNFISTSNETTLRDNIQLIDLTKTTDLMLPNVAYLSQDARKVM